MRNGECTSKLYTLHEGIHKNVLPPFPITTFLRPVGSDTIYRKTFKWENFRG